MARDEEHPSLDSVLGPMSSGDDAVGLPLASPADGVYRVLARKYRPQTFDALIGQDAMVRVLRNAFAQNRIAHGFVLTGVRGVGKTTTARIIAKGLNCIGPTGTSKADGGPTVEPCGVCEPCRSISDSRNIDVLEMDAASRTGIEDIREIIDGARYAAVSARYKVYIIDEVHMLSKAAFNGLLKTLEEPPPRVVFILATTEIRKVPVTVLSRCQRFDLKRIEASEMIEHLASIARQEAAAVSDGALALIARASEGSVRDALSLLDQAISHGGAGPVDEAEVRDMLGLVDRSRTLDLFEAVLRGAAAEALKELAEQYESGADPLVVLQDLLALTHWVTRLKIVPGAGEDPTLSAAEMARGRALAERLQMNVLTRAWSLLLKGISEVQAAPQSLAAAEMVLVKLAYAADLPTPDEALRALKARGADKVSPPPPSYTPSGGGGPRASALQEPAPVVIAASPSEQPALKSFADVVARAAEARDILLKTQLEDFVHVVRFEPGHIAFRPAAAAPADLPGRLTTALQRWTGTRWAVSIVVDEGQPTLSAQRVEARRQAIAEAEAHPLVAAVLRAFPGADVVDVRAQVVAQEPEPAAESYISDPDMQDPDEDER